MKGLLYKDLMILKQQGRSFVILLGCGILMSFSMEPAFVCGYLAVVGAMAVQGTIGYDEFDHGYSFLFTLPASRKTYVKEKYLLTFITVIVMEAAGILIAFVVSLVKTGVRPDLGEILSGGLGMVGAALLMSAISIPVRIKYGSEKSRITQYLIYAAILVIVLGLSGILKFLKIDPETMSLPAMNAVSDGLLAGGILLFFIAVYLVSEKICEGIIEKKEY